MNDATDRELLLEMRGDIKAVMAEVRKTNGRVTELERWRHETELAAARAEGAQAASSGVILTSKHVAVGTALLGLVGAASGLLARFAG